MAVQFNANDIQAAQLTPDEMRQELERVLNSKYFVHAPMKQKFLRLICEFHLNGRGSDLNEYLIGREVFDRNDSYNPATDPIVRVGAHSVREKLALYYQREGAKNGIRIGIPVGSYEPVFVKAIDQQVVVPSVPQITGSGNIDQPSITVAEGLPALDHPFPAGRKWVLVMGVASALLASAVVVLLLVNRELKRQIEGKALASSKPGSSLGQVWQPFLKNSEPTLLILSNPTVHRAVNTADPDAVTKDAITLTSEQASVLTNASGNRLPLKPDKPLQLIPAFNMYTGIGEAIGIYRLSGILQASGEATILKQSRSVGPVDLTNYDVILLGSVYSNQWSKPLTVKENFVYTNRSSIENLDHHPGEEREYKPVFNQQTGSLIEDYALVTVTPGFSGEKTVMVLAGIFSEGTEAAADYVTENKYLNELNQRLSQSGSPRYYQALLKVRVENSFPTKVSLLTIRELQATGQ
jgi:hypothetical protein